MGGAPSQVLDGLIQGGSDVLGDSQWFRNNAVSHVVSIGDEHPESTITSPPLQKIHIALPDLPSSNLLPALADCVRFIHEGRARGQCVYVHCAAGISRSSTVTISYLITIFDIDADCALKFLQKKRPAAFPNVGFRKQLRLWEASAERMELGKQLQRLDPENPRWALDLQNDYPLMNNISLSLSQQEEQLKQESFNGSCASCAYNPATGKGPPRSMLKCMQCNEVKCSRCDAEEHGGQLALHSRFRLVINNKPMPFATPSPDQPAVARLADIRNKAQVILAKKRAAEAQNTQGEKEEDPDLPSPPEGYPYSKEKEKEKEEKKDGQSKEGKKKKEGGVGVVGEGGREEEVSELEAKAIEKYIGVDVE